MNRVSIRDVNLPLSADNFTEAFTGCQITFLIDFFSGYDQITLDKASRDMTAFMTLISLLKMITLPQGVTNLVAQFVKIIINILQEHIPKKY